MQPGVRRTRPPLLSAATFVHFLQRTRNYLAACLSIYLSVPGLTATPCCGDQLREDERAKHVAGLKEIRNAHILVVDYKGRVHRVGDIDVEGRVILQCSFTKQGMLMQTEFIWLTIMEMEMNIQPL